MIIFACNLVLVNNEKHRKFKIRDSLNAVVKVEVAQPRHIYRSIGVAFKRKATGAAHLLSATTRHAISASAFISASVRKRSNPWQQTERIVSAWRFSLFSNVKPVLAAFHPPSWQAYAVHT
ncbi:Large ribosomal subunit protein bL35m [Trichinella spiralis]|uniref:Large ribosomal subunit protein bL35m n=1 Tax=Trichinella spiralis TaxID=6334 RepID=A0ABR3KYW4_TRISP